MQRAVGVLGHVQPVALLQLEPADEFLRQGMIAELEAMEAA
jgi:hypothetical protein